MMSHYIRNTNINIQSNKNQFSRPPGECAKITFIRPLLKNLISSSKKSNTMPITIVLTPQ
jgi:hypothetical protein